jgi:hypothetical protein
VLKNGGSFGLGFGFSSSDIEWKDVLGLTRGEVECHEAEIWNTLLNMLLFYVSNQKLQG